MTSLKKQAYLTRVAVMGSSQRNVGIIFLTLGLLLWVAIWTQTLQGTRAASVLDMSFPVAFSAISLALTIRARHKGARTSRR